MSNDYTDYQEAVAAAMVADEPSIRTMIEGRSDAELEALEDALLLVIEVSRSLRGAVL